MVTGEKPPHKSPPVKNDVRLVQVLDRGLFTGGLMFGGLFTYNPYIHIIQYVTVKSYSEFSCTDSIMHYGSKAFTRDYRYTTIDALRGSIGRGTSGSFSRVQLLRKGYFPRYSYSQWDLFPSYIVLFKLLKKKSSKSGDPKTKSIYRYPIIERHKIQE